ncbi:MAG TPA: DUF1127 domain-containing protein [Alphaproteobacteria bacterium]
MTTRSFDVSTQSLHRTGGVERILTAARQLLQRSARAFARHRERALDRAALAALDRRLLADLGLKRSLIDPARLRRRPCT